MQIVSLLGRYNERSTCEDRQGGAPNVTHENLAGSPIFYELCLNTVEFFHSQLTEIRMGYVVKI